MVGPLESTKVSILVKIESLSKPWTVMKEKRLQNLWITVHVFLVQLFVHFSSTVQLPPVHLLLKHCTLSSYSLWSIFQSHLLVPRPLHSTQRSGLQNLLIWKRNSSQSRELAEKSTSLQCGSVSLFRCQQLLGEGHSRLPLYLMMMR